MFALVYLNEKNDVKRYSTHRYYLPKGIIIGYSVIINGKNLWTTCQFWSKTIWRNKKVNNRTGDDYTMGWLLDYENINNHYRLTVIKLSRGSELDGDPKAI